MTAEQITILPELFRSLLPESLQGKVCLNAVGGPSIAGELAARRHTCVVITGSDGELLTRLAGLLRTPYYHVWTSTDFVGVEVAVAMKNVYALAVGLVIGLLEKEGEAENGAVMHNLAAAIYAQGLHEISYMVRLFGRRAKQCLQPARGRRPVRYRARRPKLSHGSLPGFGTKLIRKQKPTIWPM